MNIAYFIRPKKLIKYLRDDHTFRQGLEKMRHHGFTAIPVIDREGHYVGTVSQSDFLGQLLDTDSKHLSVHSLKELEHLNIRDIMQPDLYPPVRITVTMGELVNSAMNQNFIPVVDDLGSFIGIVTRQDIIRFLAQQPHPQKDGPT